MEWLEWRAKTGKFLKRQKDKTRRITSIVESIKYQNVLSHLSNVWQFATQWTIAPLSVEFFLQEDWSGLSFPTPGDCPYPGIFPMSPKSPELQVDSFNHWAAREVPNTREFILNYVGSRELIKKAECQRTDALELWC